MKRQFTVDLGKGNIANELNLYFGAAPQGTYRRLVVLNNIITPKIGGNDQMVIATFEDNDAPEALVEATRAGHHTTAVSVDEQLRKQNDDLSKRMRTLVDEVAYWKHKAFVPLPETHALATQPTIFVDKGLYEANKALREELQVVRDENAKLRTRIDKALAIIRRDVMPSLQRIHSEMGLAIDSARLRSIGVARIYVAQWRGRLARIIGTQEQL